MFAPAVVVGAMVLVTLLGVLETTNRGLNTAFEATTRDEVVVTDAFIAAAPPDARVLSFGYAPQSVGVRRTLDPAGPQLFTVDSYDCLDDLARCADEHGPDYLYIPNQGLQTLIFVIPNWHVRISHFPFSNSRAPLSQLGPIFRGVRRRAVGCSYRSRQRRTGRWLGRKSRG